MQKELKIEIDNFTFNVIFSESSKRGVPLLLLHGFTGRARDLSFLAEFIPDDYIVIAPDLPGHGDSFPKDNPDDYETDVIVERLSKLLTLLEFERVILLGYSMGGRIAYTFAAKFPEKVTAMIIESSTPGIENPTLRAKRKEADDKLAEKILNEGVYEFINYWLSLPIFATLKNIDSRLYENLKAEKISNTAIGLANSLRITGTGNMRHVWNKLSAFDFSVLLINGEHDEKYARINNRVKKALPNCAHAEISGAGHNVHMEKPHEFTDAVIDFLTNHIRLKR